MKKKILLLSLFLLTLVPVILPLLSKGMFVTDDAESMIIRSSAFHQALRDGQFPVRFLGRLNDEYGYPVATFLYPGFLYLAEPLRILRFDAIESIKIILGASLILSGIFFYLWLRKFFDEWEAFVGALVFVYTPYHLYDLLTRGSVGELLALSLAPFVLWQLERKSLIWSSLGIGFLILSHNTLGLLCGGFIFCYLLLEWYIAKKKSLTLFLPLLFGVGLGSFFWIPALFELPNTIFSQTQISNWQNYFASISLIGYTTLLILFISLVFFLVKKIAIKKHWLALLLLFIGLISLILATPLSSQLWPILPVGFVQFPFRFLSVTLLCVGFLAASTVSLLQGKQKIIVSILLIGSLFFSSYQLLAVTRQMQPDKSASFYETNMATTTVKDEYLPIWVKEKSSGRAEKKVEIVKGKGEITNLVSTTNHASFDSNADRSTVARINTIYWPGWQILVDGQMSKISYNNSKGLMEVSLPKGNHHVQTQFRETSLRLISDMLSLMSLLGLFGIALSKKKK